ncbi:hypothetical protein GALMADRAFT_560766 [Galerina marginata CBS 339.88]|uniref:Uncharacterized protein n=1 Tax=Galerina marginata (strain CBS 339.88) TaxID=685588 RepID=A0A067T6Q8_GALM3|nr:hypothetical protein GALMADRAFT_560766 [Galerina marginata CBS 339.88]
MCLASEVRTDQEVHCTTIPCPHPARPPPNQHRHEHRKPVIEHLTPSLGSSPRLDNQPANLGTRRILRCWMTPPPQRRCSSGDQTDYRIFILSLPTLKNITGPRQPAPEPKSKPLQRQHPRCGRLHDVALVVEPRDCRYMLGKFVGGLRT